MSRGTGVPGQNVDVNVAASGNKAQAVCQIFPKDWYTWTDRNGITAPDFTGTLNLSTLTPIAVGDAGYLQIAVDGNASSAAIGLAIVTWDSRGYPLSVSTPVVTTSGWAINSSGYYVLSNNSPNNDATILFSVVNASSFIVLVQSMVATTTLNIHWRLF